MWSVCIYLSSKQNVSHMFNPGNHFGKFAYHVVHLCPSQVPSTIPASLSLCVWFLGPSLSLSSPIPFLSPPSSVSELCTPAHRQLPNKSRPYQIASNALRFSHSSLWIALDQVNISTTLLRKVSWLKGNYKNFTIAAPQSILSSNLSYLPLWFFFSSRSGHASMTCTQWLGKNI